MNDCKVVAISTVWVMKVMIKEMTAMTMMKKTTPDKELFKSDRLKSKPPTQMLISTKIQMIIPMIPYGESENRLKSEIEIRN